MKSTWKLFCLLLFYSISLCASLNNKGEEDGGYSCTYKVPHSFCSNLTGDSKTSYIAKITEIGWTNDEAKIGKQIMQIENYEDYFSPVLEHCPFNHSTISQHEQDKCFLLQTSARYIYNTVKYIDGGQLNKYLERKRISGANILELISQTHMYILKAIIQFNEVSDPIIHNDLKANNILFDTNLGVPKIIDFGTSFTESNLLSLETLNDYLKYFNFYQFVGTYDAEVVWCMEVDLLCYIMKHFIPNNNTPTMNLSLDDTHIQEFHNVVNRYMVKMELQDELHTHSFVNHFTLDYLFSFKNTELKILVQDLVETCKTWDNYSVALMYHIYIKSIKDLYPKNGFTNSYIKFINSIIFAVPSRHPRQTARESFKTLKIISKTFSTDSLFF